MRVFSSLKAILSVLAWTIRPNTLTYIEFFGGNDFFLSLHRVNYVTHPPVIISLSFLVSTSLRRSFSNGSPPSYAPSFVTPPRPQRLSTLILLPWRCLTLGRHADPTRRHFYHEGCRNKPWRHGRVMKTWHLERLRGWGRDGRCGGGGE